MEYKKNPTHEILILISISMLRKLKRHESSQLTPISAVSLAESDSRWNERAQRTGGTFVRVAPGTEVISLAVQTQVHSVT